MRDYESEVGELAGEYYSKTPGSDCIVYYSQHTRYGCNKDIAVLCKIRSTLSDGYRFLFSALGVQG
jgi:hypothetical protein